MKNSEISGLTLVEVLFVSALIGLLFSLGSSLSSRVLRFVRINSVQGELQREMRALHSQAVSFLRLASAKTVVIDRLNSAQPELSRITFDRYNSSGGTETISFYQSGRFAEMSVNGSTHTLARNIKTVTFYYPNVSDGQIVSFSAVLDQEVFKGQKKDIGFSAEKVRIMNP